MEMNNGILSIDLKELFRDEKFCKEAAQYAVFEKWLFHGIVELLIKDEVDWNDDESPSYCCASFGRSYFEEARVKVIEKISEIYHTQIKVLQKERDTINEYYQKYLSKSIVLEDDIRSLQYQLRQEKAKNAPQEEAVENIG
jgi:hypothetical protein